MAERHLDGLHAVRTFEQLKDAFFRYYDTPFGLADSGLQRERRALLDRDGGVYRRPLIELRPDYVTAGHDLGTSVAAAGAPPELEAFAHAGLVPAGRPLYRHQEEALKLAAQPGTNVVITAGTGSGKTESFLLPILASLLEESRSWSGQAARNTSWWHGEQPYQHQRSGESGREQAVRAMILYPMNALVDDQLIRLRRALDSEAVRSWMDDYRRGHRFYFGRYTGATPVTGDVGGDRGTRDLREHLRSVATRSARAQELGGETAHFVPRLDGAEMRSRWDMIDAPPDLLITNYSMLNVMLLRDRERAFFEGTRRWLQQDASRQFTLVVDELHMYRGTAGTEVALLIRNLLHRLGLTGASPQLRVLAASASLDPARDRQYLQEFFGVRGESFCFLSGETTRPSSETVSTTAALARLAGHQVAADTSAKGDVAQLLEELERAGAHRALWSAFYRSDDGQELAHPQARSEAALRATLFPGVHDDRARTALQTLLEATAHAEGRPGWPRLRSHLFFRNVPGVWACIDPQCPHVRDEFRSPPGAPERRVGRLHAQPVSRCSCGSRVLELLYCQNCGDAMLGGFAPESGLQEKTVRTLLLADVPELAKLPDRASLERTASNYVVYWPRPSKPDVEDLTWSVDKNQVTFAFRPSSLTPANGELRNLAPGKPASGWSFHVQVARAKDGRPVHPLSSFKPFPTQCPACGDDWEIVRGQGGKALPITDPLRQRSPVRAMRTGFEKINQVLMTELLSQLPEEQRKLIVFTDSRQDAAKLSAGMGLRHYQDLLRLLLHEEVSRLGPRADVELAKRHVQRVDNSPGGRAERDKLRAANRGAALELERIWEEDSGADLATEQRLVAEVTAAPSLDDFRARVGRRLLSMGVNPAGPQRSYQATAAARGLPARSWTRLYSWAGDPQPRSDLFEAEAGLLSRIDSNLRQELLEGLFSGAGRDFESIGLGWLTLRDDRDPGDRKPSAPQALTRASLRVLADARRFFGLRNGSNKPPARLLVFWTAAARELGVELADVRDQVEAQWGNRVKDYLIDPEQVTLRPAGEESWTCSTCQRQHLHRGCGLCTRCRRPLPDAGSAVVHDEDYYAWRATSGRGRFRLNAAELTGQTDREDAQSRQTRFQGIFLGEEQPLPDTVDLLSVTTTMEAGVDIGALEAVALGNMPPTRFNYQQRVGRAGRRTSPVAVALTVCRGRSHDEYYFADPALITNEPTPKPYLALDRPEIFSRVLGSEVLRSFFQQNGAALADAGLSAGLTSNVHGQFGKSEEWPRASALVRQWVARNGQLVRDIATALSREAPAGIQQRDWHAWSCGELLDAVDRAAAAPAGHADLSQRLAEAGVLPMFGFPTRVRSLYLKRPQRSFPWPPAGVIDRELPVAVSQFAPMSEVVRDGAVYTAVGVTAFKPGGPTPAAVADPLGDPRALALCRNCSHVQEVEDVTSGDVPQCPSCGAGEEFFRTIPVREPAGFRAGPPRDFDGNFSWSARAMAARAWTNLDELRSADHDGVLAFSGPGVRHIVNDNGGRLFRFRPASSSQDSWGGYVSVDAIAAERVPGGTPAGDEISVALGAAQPTDFLFLGPQEPVREREGLRLSLGHGALQPHGAVDPGEGRRGAWYSLAFLLRTVAASHLDVQTLELEAGLYSTRRDGELCTFAFIADALENGAGFSTHLGQPGELEEYLAAVDKHLTRLGEPEHASSCTSSCYRCLRDYSNMAYHALLDWRLAADLAGLLRGRPLAPSRDRERRVLSTWADGYGAEVYDGLPAAAALLEHPVLGSCAVIAKHPLEASEQGFIAPRLQEALHEVERLLPADGVAVFVDTFLLDRDPGHALSLAGQASR